MRRIHPPSLIVLILSLASYIQCFSALEGSSCRDICIPNQNLASGNLVCTDDDFLHTDNGRALKQCLTCLESSTSGSDADFNLLLYFISFIQQHCLAGNAQPSISVCFKDCDSIDNAFSSNNIFDFFQSPFSYCTASSGSYSAIAPRCATCLESQQGTVILGKFVEAGKLSCDNQNAISNASFASFGLDLFDTTPNTKATLDSASTSSKADISPGQPTQSASTTQVGTSVATHDSKTNPSAAITSTSSPNQATAEQTNITGGLNRGLAAAVGVVVGILGVATIVVVAMLARRRLADRQQQHAPSWEKISEGPAMIQNAAPAPRAVPTAVEVAAPPFAARHISMKSIRSLRSWTNSNARMLGWYEATYPKKSSDLSALPQKGWD